MIESAFGCANAKTKVLVENLPPALGARVCDDEIGQQRHAKITTFAAVTVAEFVVLSPPPN